MASHKARPGDCLFCVRMERSSKQRKENENDFRRRINELDDDWFTNLSPVRPFLTWLLSPLSCQVCMSLVVCLLRTSLAFVMAPAATGATAEKKSSKKRGRKPVKTVVGRAVRRTKKGRMVKRSVGEMNYTAWINRVLKQVSVRFVLNCALAGSPESAHLGQVDVHHELIRQRHPRPYCCGGCPPHALRKEEHAPLCRCPSRDSSHSSRRSLDLCAYGSDKGSGQVQEQRGQLGDSSRTIKPNGPL